MSSTNETRLGSGSGHPTDLVGLGPLTPINSILFMSQRMRNPRLSGTDQGVTIERSPLCGDLVRKADPGLESHDHAGGSAVVLEYHYTDIVRPLFCHYSGRTRVFYWHIAFLVNAVQCTIVASKGRCTCPRGRFNRMLSISQYSEALFVAQVIETDIGWTLEDVGGYCCSSIRLMVHENYYTDNVGLVGP